MSTSTSLDSYVPVRGDLIGPWRVVDRVDSGSFGVIYRVVLAREPGAGPYAMKMAVQAGDPRFEREVELLSRVDHPGLPRFHDAGTWRAPSGRGHPYVVMSWVDGVPLYQWSRATGRTLSSRQALRFIAQLARSLEALHRHGLHRDVKGDNVLVSLDGHAVLLDLGAGWFPGSPPLTEGSLPPGTPQYRSPQALEHRERHRLDPEARYEAGPADDVYALGVTAYRLVTGTYPPEPGGSGRLLPPSALATVCPELDALILRMLSLEPGARGTAGELAQSLERAATGRRRKLDASLLPSPSVLPTVQSRVRGPWAWRARVLARAALPVAAVLIVLLVLSMVTSEVRHPSEGRWSEAPLIAETWMPPPVETPDAGVGEEALTRVTSGTPLPRWAAGMGLALPKKPLPGQRTPPCTSSVEDEINGGCWISVRKRTPPCGSDAYEYEGTCYIPSSNLPRPTTSDPR